MIWYAFHCSSFVSCSVHFTLLSGYCILPAWLTRASSFPPHHPSSTAFSGIPTRVCIANVSPPTLFPLCDVLVPISPVAFFPLPVGHDPLLLGSPFHFVGIRGCVILPFPSHVAEIAFGTSEACPSMEHISVWTLGCQIDGRGS